MFLAFSFWWNLCQLDLAFVILFHFTFSKIVFMTLLLINVNSTFSFITVNDYITISCFL